MFVEALESRQLLAVASSGDEVPEYPEYVASEILVKFRPTALPVNAAALPSAVGLEKLSLVSGLYNVSLANSISVEEALVVYRARSDVLYAEPNDIVRMDVIPSDSQFGDLWGLDNTGQAGGTPDADIDAPDAWNITTGSSQIVVAIIDSGVDYTHLDLAANIWTNPGEIPGNGLDDDGNGFIDDVHGYDFYYDNGDPLDDNLHGTHVAGTIGAVGNNGLGVAGVNWNVQVMALKAFSAGGTGSRSAILAALDYVVMMKNHGVNIKLTSNSWGGRLPIPSQAMYDAIAATGDAGMLFVAAAGNSARSNDVQATYPAAYDLDNIISVAASDRNDAKASFSNWGATSVDLAAPGVDILSTFPTYSTFAMNSRGWTPNYGTASGTSMAAPHVAGVAALAWSVRPDATYREIRAAILNGVDPIDDFRVDGPTPVATGGRLNALGTLKQLGLFVAGTTPAEGAVVATPPSAFDVRFSFPIVPESLQPSDLTVNGVPADAVTLSADKLAATFMFNAGPVTTEGLYTLRMAQGVVAWETHPEETLYAYEGMFRYDTVPLEALAVLPADGSTLTLPGPFTLDVHFNEALDPASVEASDLVLSGIPGATIAGVSLVDGNTTARFTLAGVAAEGILNASLAAGTVTDAFGNRNPAVFTFAYTTDFGTVGLAAPYAETALLGALMEKRTASGQVHLAGDSDRFTLALSAGETISVTVVPQTIGLASAVELRDEAGNLLGSMSAAPDRVASLQTIAAPTSGTYTLIVSGANATTGDYRIAVTFNAALEAEASDFAGNGTLPAAQNIDASEVALGGGATRLAVVGTVGTLPIKSSEDFESGELPLSLTTYSSDSSGRIEVAAPDATGNSSRFALWMDSTVLGHYVLNEAVYSVNLAGMTAANLSFSHVRGGVIRNGEAVGDRPHLLPADFTGHFNGDGVAISDDGEHWHAILNAPLDLAWTSVTIDLAAAAAAAGMNLNADFQIKFQQYDFITHDLIPNANPPGIYGGRAYDDIRVWLPDEQDTYQLTLEAGERLTVSAGSLEGGQIGVQLLDASGAPLQPTGLAGPTEGDPTVLQFFVVPASGSYYLAATGPIGAAYSLVAIKNAPGAVNEPPSFITGPDLAANDTDGLLVFENWAASIVSGPPGEEPQSASFLVETPDDSLFLVPPQIDADGTLRFQPAPNVQGVAEIIVRLQDSGGTASGGVDTSAPQAFQITISKPHAWHNVLKPLDVTGDGSIAPDDVLAIVNYLNAFRAGPVPEGAAAGGPYYDANGDNQVAPNDVLAVINYINASRASGEGEGESTMAATGDEPLESILDWLAADVALPRRRAYSRT